MGIQPQRQSGQPLISQQSITQTKNRNPGGIARRFAQVCAICALLLTGIWVGQYFLIGESIFSLNEPQRLRENQISQPDSSLISDVAYQSGNFGSSQLIPTVHHSPGIQVVPAHYPQLQFPGIPPNTQAPPSQVPIGNREVSQQLRFNFQDAPWPTVLRWLTDQAGLSLQMTQIPQGTFTYYDQRYHSMTDGLDLINDFLLEQGLLLIRTERTAILISANAKIPAHLIPLIDLEKLTTLGRNELASILIPVHQSDLIRTVNEIQQLNTPLGSVVPVSRSHVLMVSDTGASLRRIYEIVVKSDYSDLQHATFYYRLRNTKADEIASAISQHLSQSQSTPAANGQAGVASVRGAAHVIPEQSTNTLIVQAPPGQMGEIKELILYLDQPPPQVLIQAMLVEVEIGNTDELGVELGLQDSVLFQRSIIDNILTIAQTTTAPNGVQTTSDTIISQSASPGFNFNNQPLGNNVAASPRTVAPQGLTNFGVGRVNGDLGFGGLVLSAGSESISVLLRALAANFRVDILSRPQIRTVHNHEALIQAGQQVPVVDGVSINPNGGANPVVRQDKSGIILKVTPRINPDGTVVIDVNAEKSQFRLTPGTGVPLFTDATNGNVIESPVKDITTASATVSVQNSQTIVLGGMITTDNTVVSRRVPFLGDIPVLGRLFRYDLDRTVRKELLVFLTPQIINNRGRDEELKTLEIQRTSFPYEKAEQMHGYVFADSFSNATQETPSYLQTMPSAQMNQYGSVHHPAHPQFSPGHPVYQQHPRIQNSPQPAYQPGLSPHNYPQGMSPQVPGRSPPAQMQSFPQMSPPDSSYSSSPAWPTQSQMVQQQNPVRQVSSQVPVVVPQNQWQSSRQQPQNRSPVRSVARPNRYDPQSSYRSTPASQYP